MTLGPMVFLRLYSELRTHGLHEPEFYAFDSHRAPAGVPYFAARKSSTVWLNSAGFSSGA